MDDILKCDHSNESYWEVIACGTVYYAVQDGSDFESVDAIEKYFPVVLFITLYKVARTLSLWKKS